MRHFALLAVLASIMIMPAAALAQAPVRDGYGGGGDVLGTQNGGGGGNSGSLPFTGLDAGLLVGGGLLMLGVGLGLRRVSRATI